MQASGLAALATAFSANTAEGAEATELNALMPTPEQTTSLAALPDKPVCMVNLLKFKDATEYQKYGAMVAPLLAELKAEIVISGQCQTTVIGGAEWDAFAVVRYPSAKTLMGMFQKPEYQKAHVHREAGLDGQLLIAVFEGSGLDFSSDDDGEVTAEQVMNNLDTDKDGKISEDEAPDQLKQSFQFVDTDGDGSIDLEEAQTIADFLNAQ